MYLIIEKLLQCVALFVVTAAVYADTSELSVQSQEIVGSEQYLEVSDEDDDIEIGDDGTQDFDSYRITRKEHSDNPCERSLDQYGYESNWYDHSQMYINSRFCEPALWFDNFFSSDRIIDEGVAGTYVRWRNDFSYDEEDHFEFKTRLTFSVELPGFKKKLRVTFEGEEDESLRDIAPGNNSPDPNSLGLQLDLAENARSKFNVNVSLTPRIRFRYRYTYPVFKKTILRFTEEAQWRNGTNSALSRFDFEQVVGDNFLFRSSTEVKVSEDFDGVDWLQAFVMYHWISKKSSLAYESSAVGITEPVSVTTDYRIGVRFRQNIHREWLFYEVVPEFTWPVTFDTERLMIEQDRRSKWRLFFRLEIHFGNAYKKRYQDYNKL